MKTFVKSNYLKALLLIVIITAVSFSAAAVDGREVMERVQDRESGDTQHVLAGMDLIDSDGNVRSRVIEVWSQDNQSDLRETLMVFHEPASVKDTRFLQKENEEADDDQWIYLPDLGRVRRISGGQGSDSFMGTDFTYDDLKSREIDNFEYELLREEEFNGYQTYVVEAIPKSPEDEQYAKTISWITKEHFIPVKLEMYDKDSEELSKVMTVDSEIKKVDGIWTAFSTTMENLASGHSTRLYIQQRDGNYLLEYNKKIDDRRFTQQYLETGR
ncbi:outer membrane lipoprotein-sorting protein [Halanaerobium saccharolyticum]|uniref:Outer membrane lipoprotein-sorting protein n=1 Tax=Halanaerobium saccharolyticum TaxID=43595 RepID=A0A2T5RG19_9FIRM|nr:outer membrane lipoprotein-sorting protein [Halanaerobium saccharolyticum]PTV93324.1 outer membrane lipoprotein-sorting protein [Halanaerobium saccharolyticum]